MNQWSAIGLTKKWNAESGLETLDEGTPPSKQVTEMCPASITTPINENSTLKKIVEKLTHDVNGMLVALVPSNFNSVCQAKHIEMQFGMLRSRPVQKRVGMGEERKKEESGHHTLAKATAGVSPPSHSILSKAAAGSLLRQLLRRRQHDGVVQTPTAVWKELCKSDEWPSFVKLHHTVAAQSMHRDLKSVTPALRFVLNEDNLGYNPRGSKIALPSQIGVKKVHETKRAQKQKRKKKRKIVAETRLSGSLNSSTTSTKGE
jgi:hypothetical protein